LRNRAIPRRGTWIGVETSKTVGEFIKTEGGVHLRGKEFTVFRMK